MPDGVALCRAVLDGERLAGWTAAIDARYRELDAARAAGGSAAVEARLPAGERFAATASSVTIGGVLSQDDVRAVIAAACAGPAGTAMATALGGAIACDLDQAWVRRQYAPARYPAEHAPHNWHQDGGLGFDYLVHANAPLPPDALLRMATCWIALTACGVTAPGLELVTRRLGALLPVGELSDVRIGARFAANHLWRPALGAGDALVFGGDIVHRTHVTPAMTDDRTSIELRFFPADDPPARLAGDRFLRL